MEDWSGLNLLADVCAQELRDLSTALVPVNFPKKKRSKLIKNKTETTSLKLDVSPTVIGKRCCFQLDHGHGSDNGADCNEKKMKHSVNANSFALSSSSSALLIHGHGNGTDGDDYVGNMKQSLTATGAAFDSSASTTTGGVDGHCHGVCGDNNHKGKQKQKQRVSFSLSIVDKDDPNGKKRQAITFRLSSSGSVTTVDYLGTKTEKQNITDTGSSPQEETGASKPSSSSCLNTPPPLFQLNSVCPNLPRPFMDRIQGMGGSEVMFVIEKALFKSDLDRGLNHLTIPCIQIENEFLREEEKMNLCRKQDDGKHNQGMEVSVIEPCLDITTLCLKKYDFKSTSSYVLVKNWINVANKNQLMRDMKVQLWSFRVNNALCFALVNLSRQISTTLTS